MAAGHVTSIEPGFYEDGKFGIRLENMAIVREVKTRHTFGGKPYLGFEPVTLVPYCQVLLDAKLLTAEEKKWLNDYHADVYEKTHRVFESDPLTLSWLRRETQPV